MQLILNGTALPFIVEETAHAGVVRVAKKVIADVEKVTGKAPALLRQAVDAPHILCATLGCSPMADALIAAGKLPQADLIRGKWECYAIARVDGNLVILGSDKRGTEFGMFELSRYIGVSPLCYWGDAEPRHQDNVCLDGLCTVSKEPSVKYRGLFINDEWPCFGNWCMEHFGGVNAQMYDHVFELLLRLKANYMWPAMWASVFAEEGPGSLNEELADEYGIVVGNSHHEPCLRAGEEFKHSIRAGGAFGTDWNFVRNREGITRFWAEGLKRSGKYEHLITIGMRGEADSAMLGEDSGLRANIEYLKDVITTQEALIQQYAGPKSKDQPRLLALYKEVEPFFYGNETVQGLKDWEGLTNTVCMLCEDNHGFMRSLPTPEMTATLKARNCGWGMYYHVDYHGGPVSYEWMPSTPFAKLWEQMCLAYDYGIRDVWILNTGDLKGNEVSLHQFLDLAYDYDKWGSHDVLNWRKWVEHFVAETFPGLNAVEKTAVEQIFIDLYDMNGKRRPEALNAGVYHPCHELEAHRMSAKIDELSMRGTGFTIAAYADDLGLGKQSNSNVHKHRDALYSMLGYPLAASLALLRMHIASGLNAHYAAQGRPKANVHALAVKMAMDSDRNVGERFAAWKDGKWSGMEREEHIGFTSWNEDGCKMPLRTEVMPMSYPRLSLSRKDSLRTYGRTYFAPMVLEVHDFCDAGVNEVILEAANDGEGELELSVEGGAPWLEVKLRPDNMMEYRPDADGNLALNPPVITVHALNDIRLICDRSKMTSDEEQTTLVIRSSGEGVHANAVVHVDVCAKKHAPNEKPAFMPVKKVVTIDAHHFCDKHDADGAAFRVLPGLGRSGNAVKVYPTSASFPPDADAPSLTYRFFAENTGVHTCELWLTPTSPVQPKTAMRCTLEIAGEKQVVTCVPADYRAGENSDMRWCAAMVNHIRKVKVNIHCAQGLNEVTIGAVDPNFSLERILIYPEGHIMPESYLGPQESSTL